MIKLFEQKEICQPINIKNTNYTCINGQNSIVVKLYVYIEKFIYRTMQVIF